MTYEEFAEFAERFARDHGEPGTLSVRHLQRLAAGRGENGKPLGRPRPATARLLERIFGVPIDRLLQPPVVQQSESATELRQRLRASAKVDGEVLNLLRDQLMATRRLDRQLGAAVTHDEGLAKVTQVRILLAHCVSLSAREGLAALLSELCTLAGWQALDVGQPVKAWRYYTEAFNTATSCPNAAFAAHSAAGQAFTLIDLGNTSEAVELLAATRRQAASKTSHLMRSWLAAAHGEALAADGRKTECQRAFDYAETFFPDAPSVEEGPYVVLDSVHLSRWRGHALARLGDAAAVDVLASALDRLDPTFTRAEVGLRVDLATAFKQLGEIDAAREQAKAARQSAAAIGSARQLTRLQRLAVV